jgi:hypothetical protein
MRSIHSTRNTTVSVDESLLDKDSADFQHFTTAMRDRPALQAHVLEWLQGSSGVRAVHVPPREQRKIHINFTSMSALDAALSGFPFQARCGSIGSASQWNSKPCGPPRHKMPEVLQLSCVPRNMKAM